MEMELNVKYSFSFDDEGDAANPDVVRRVFDIAGRDITARIGEGRSYGDIAGEDYAVEWALDKWGGD